MRDSQPTNKGLQLGQSSIIPARFAGQPLPQPNANQQDRKASSSIARPATELFTGIEFLQFFSEFFPSLPHRYAIPFRESGLPL